MGQKVNPHGLRVGVIKDWDSRWYAEADFADNLVEDHKIRTFLKKKLYSAGVSKIEIERASDKVKIILYTAKPGVVIGKGGAEIEKTKAQVQKLTDKKVFVDIKEVKRPDRDAQLVAENIAQQLENRISFRRCFVTVTKGIPIQKPAVNEATKKAAGVFARLLAACDRLRRVVMHNEGGANKDLARFADQINSLCDKWDR